MGMGMLLFVQLCLGISYAQSIMLAQRKDMTMHLSVPVSNYGSH